MHGDGTPVVLVPGLGGVGSYWRPQVEALSPHFRVVLYDHRGIGRSTPASGAQSVAQMAADLRRLLDALGIARVHLVGHSLGGAVAQVLAIESPERLSSLVLCASWSKADPFMMRVSAIGKTVLIQGGPAAFLQFLPLFLYPPWWINAHDDLLASEAQRVLTVFPPLEVMLSRIDAICSFDHRAGLGSIRTPTLVLCARDDTLAPVYCSEALASAIPGARLVLLDQGGHACSLTESAAFNAVMVPFLLAQEGRGASQVPPGVC